MQLFLWICLGGKQKPQNNNKHIQKIPNTKLQRHDTRWVSSCVLLALHVNIFQHQILHIPQAYGFKWNSSHTRTGELQFSYIYIYIYMTLWGSHKVTSFLNMIYHTWIFHSLTAEHLEKLIFNYFFKCSASFIQTNSQIYSFQTPESVGHKYICLAKRRSEPIWESCSKWYRFWWVQQGKLSHASLVRKLNLTQLWDFAVEPQSIMSNYAWMWAMVTAKTAEHLVWLKIYLKLA